MSIMTSTATYVLPAPSFLNHDLELAPSWLADLEDRREFTSDDALAASGDCFITIATRLDKLAQGLPLDSVEQIGLEHVVTSLFYLQDHYAVIAKHKLGK